MSWASKAVKKVKHAWNKYKREIIGVTTLGASEAGRQLSGYNQMKDMEKLADQQAALQEQQLKMAQQQAYQDAGNQVSTSSAGEQQALAKILAKRTAAQRAYRTQGQQRFGD